MVWGGYNVKIVLFFIQPFCYLIFLYYNITHMYSKIVNPKTGRQVSVKSRLGKDILRKYLFILSGGLGPAPAKSPKKRQNTTHPNVLHPMGVAPSAPMGVAPPTHADDDDAMDIDDDAMDIDDVVGAAPSAPMGVASSGFPALTLAANGQRNPFAAPAPLSHSAASVPPQWRRTQRRLASSAPMGAAPSVASHPAYMPVSSSVASHPAYMPVAPSAPMGVAPSRPNGVAPIGPSHPAYMPVSSSSLPNSGVSVVTRNFLAAIAARPLSNLIKGFLPKMDNRWMRGPKGAPSSVSWISLAKIPTLLARPPRTPSAARMPYNFGDITIVKFVRVVSMPSNVRPAWTRPAGTMFASREHTMYPWLRQAEKDLKDEIINSGYVI